MIYRITWADRMRAFWNRIPAWVVDTLLVAVVAACLLLCAGCGETRPAPTITPPPTLGPPSPAAPPTALASKDAEIAAAVGTVARLTRERDDLRLAPLRTSLAWAEGVALLGMLAGIGMAVAAMFWGLGFGWKIPAGIAAAFAGVLAASLAASWALGHVGWIIGGTVAVAALAILWAVRKHMTLVDAAKQAWNGVPDSVNLSAQAESLLGRLK